MPCIGGQPSRPGRVPESPFIDRGFPLRRGRPFEGVGSREVPPVDMRLLRPCACKPVSPLMIRPGRIPDAENIKSRAVPCKSGRNPVFRGSLSHALLGIASDFEGAALPGGPFAFLDMTTPRRCASRLRPSFIFRSGLTAPFVKWHARQRFLKQFLFTSSL